MKIGVSIVPTVERHYPQSLLPTSRLVHSDSFAGIRHNGFCFRLVPEHPGVTFSQETRVGSVCNSRDAQTGHLRRNPLEWIHSLHSFSRSSYKVQSNNITDMTLETVFKSFRPTSGRVDVSDYLLPLVAFRFIEDLEAK